MFLNVATFSVTHRSISSTKKKIDFFLTLYLIIYDYVLLSCSANFGAPCIFGGRDDTAEVRKLLKKI
jgi:hypothetical protein